MQKQNIDVPALVAGDAGPTEEKSGTDDRGLSGESATETYQTREGCLGLSIMILVCGIVFVGALLLIGGFE
jgi:hypothetical protein